MAIRRLAILFVLFLGSGFLFSDSRLPCGSAEQYRALLGQVAERSEHLESLTELADEVPAQCDFTAAGHTFHLSNFGIQGEIRQIAAQQDGESRTHRLKILQNELRQRRSEIDAYERSVDPSARPKLQEIMQRREFRHVGSQDQSALLQEWVYLMIEKLFSRIFKDPSRVELGAKIAVWTLCIVVGGLILWKLYRWATRERPREVVRDVIPFAPSARNWRDWLGEARAAAARSDLREAVHASYWACISHLEASGAWRPDRARTPREYLRLIAKSDSARPLLTDITHDFELIWYGNHLPAFSEWESFLAKVERIGCR